MTPPEVVDFNEFQEREINMDHIDARLIDFLDSLDIEAVHARYFFSVPSNIYNIHKDKPGNYEYARLNWIFGGADSKMIWYAPKPNIKVEWIRNKLGERIRRYPVTDCIELEQKHLTGPNLVNVGILHSMHGGTEKRHCYSFFLRDKRIGNGFMTWDEALPRFQHVLGEE